MTTTRVGEPQPHGVASGPLRLVLAGAGGFGREVFSWADAAAPAGEPWSEVVFIDDNPLALAGSRTNARHLTRISAYEPRPGDVVAVTLGEPAVKKRVCELLAARSVRFHTLIHPTALVGAGSEIGEGSVLCPGCVVTADARIGRHVTLNVHATVGHDAIVADYATIGGHADVTGGARLDEGVFLGSHAVVAPRVRVRAFAVVGAGTVAFRDVAERTTVVGVPAVGVGVFARGRAKRSGDEPAPGSSRNG